jgi:NSS family neurotransmitter:Na+ symporter
MREHANSVSEFAVGAWWSICLRYLSAGILALLVTLNLYGDLTTPYSGYGNAELLAYGWAVITACILFGLALRAAPGRPGFAVKHDESLWREP